MASSLIFPTPLSRRWSKCILKAQWNPFVSGSVFLRHGMTLYPNARYRLAEYHAAPPHWSPRADSTRAAAVRRGVRGVFPSPLPLWERVARTKSVPGEGARHDVRSIPAFASRSHPLPQGERVKNRFSVKVMLNQMGLGAIVIQSRTIAFVAPEKCGRAVLWRKRLDFGVGHPGKMAPKTSNVLWHLRHNPAAADFARSGSLQRFNGAADIRIETRTAGVEMRQDCGTHARIPEFPDVLGDAGHCLAITLALEEPADLIGHIDQPVRRHGRLLARRLPGRQVQT